MEYKILIVLKCLIKFIAINTPCLIALFLILASITIIKKDKSWLKRLIYKLLNE